ARDLEPAHRAAAREHHLEAQPADVDRLAAARYAPELVRDQAAAGVEVVVGQRHPERAVDLGDVGVAGHPLGAVGQRVDAGIDVALVEFVLDLADDLFHTVPT